MQSSCAFALSLCFFNDIPNLTIFGHYVRPMCDPSTTLSALRVKHQLFAKSFLYQSIAQVSKSALFIPFMHFFDETPIFVIFEPFVRSTCDPVAPIILNRKCVESTEKKNIKNEPNLTSVAQSVQKLFHIQGNFSQELRWKLATPCQH